MRKLKLSNPKRGINSYAHYSGMGIQMLVIIFLGVFGGYKLDQWLGTQPILIVVLSLSSVIVAIYVVTKDLLRKKK